jgi:hypothetical protein
MTYNKVHLTKFGLSKEQLEQYEEAGFMLYFYKDLNNNMAFKCVEREGFEEIDFIYQDCFISYPTSCLCDHMKQATLDFLE